MSVGAVATIDASGYMAVPAPRPGCYFKDKQQGDGPNGQTDWSFLAAEMGSAGRQQGRLLEPGSRYHSGGNTAQSVPEQTTGGAQTGGTHLWYVPPALTQPEPVQAGQRLFGAAAFALQQPLILEKWWWM